MMNASFFIYLFASCVAIAIVALLLLIFKVQTEKSSWKMLLMLFVILTFLLGLLYFVERFYTNDFETKGGWSHAERALDLILASAQMFTWCWFLREKAGLTDRRIARVTNGILIGIFIVQMIIYLGLMDEHYYIASDLARAFATAAYILFMVLLTGILIVHMSVVRRGIQDKRPRAYLIGISLLLLIDLLGESFYCIMLFRASPLLEAGLYVAFDLVSVIFLAINILTAIYIYRCEISPVIPVSPEQAEAEQREERLEVLRAGGLSEREIEVAQLLLDGSSYDEIAERLSISKYTVKRHAHNVYQKLEVANKVDLMNRFRQK